MESGHISGGVLWWSVFVEGADRSQITLFPESLEDYVADDNPVRLVDGFVEQFDLYGLGHTRPTCVANQVGCISPDIGHRRSSRQLRLRADFVDLVAQKAPAILVSKAPNLNLGIPKQKPLKTALFGVYFACICAYISASKRHKIGQHH